jgi:hypothetical protein
MCSPFLQAGARASLSHRRLRSVSPCASIEQLASLFQAAGGLRGYHHTGQRIEEIRSQAAISSWSAPRVVRKAAKSPHAPHALGLAAFPVNHRSGPRNQLFGVP